MTVPRHEARVFAGNRFRFRELPGADNRFGDEAYAAAFAIAINEILDAGSIAGDLRTDITAEDIAASPPRHLHRRPTARTPSRSRSPAEPPDGRPTNRQLTSSRAVTGARSLGARDGKLAGSRSDPSHDVWCSGRHTAPRSIKTDGVTLGDLFEAQ
jgi:hypothetical protein